MHLLIGTQLVLLFLLLGQIRVIRTGSSDMEEGSACLDPDYPELDGFCSVFQDCLYAPRLVQKQIWPAICCYNETHTLICCPYLDPDGGSTADSTPASDPIPEDVPNVDEAIPRDSIDSGSAQQVPDSNPVPEEPIPEDTVDSNPEQSTIPDQIPDSQSGDTTYSNTEESASTDQVPDSNPVPEEPIPDETVDSNPEQSTIPDQVPDSNPPQEETISDAKPDQTTIPVDNAESQPIPEEALDLQPEEPTIPDNTSNLEPEKDTAPEEKAPEGTRLAEQHCDTYHPKFEGARIMVVGGEEALSKEFPHMAVIGFGSNENQIQWLCGGSLISEKYVLTAAHCLDSDDYGVARWVRLGDLDLKDTSDDARPQNFRIVERIPHPDYKWSAHYDDIALVELDRNAVLDEYVKPACLYLSDGLPDGELIATGWGRTSFAGETSAQLMKVSLDLVTNEECRRAYRHTPKDRLEAGIDPQSQICASAPGKDTCQGDSGGPLQIQEHRVDWTNFIVGVTSFGKACGIGSSPGVYTRVTPYINWIERIVWQSDDWVSLIDFRSGSIN